MFKTCNSLRYFDNATKWLIKRDSSKMPKNLKNSAVIMCNDSKHILCFHPEPEHPYELTKEIKREIQNTSALKEENSNLYLKRFDNKPALTPRNHWVDAIRLSKTFNEHPIIFRRANRESRIKQFLEKTNPIRPNRKSI
ncbi:unnamed protein product [Brachionus calyciflorus]|uniref:Uncharacterized protein n=1 Tax=Brachionus calyciflorus TaxID=104777 RepID=A0A813W2Q6_9BILA|nr:unnamed protein product [Brachionus calyciflorus]